MNDVCEVVCTDSASEVLIIFLSDVIPIRINAYNFCAKVMQSFNKWLLKDCMTFAQKLYALILIGMTSLRKMIKTSLAESVQTTSHTSFIHQGQQDCPKASWLRTSL